MRRKTFQGLVWAGAIVLVVGCTQLFFGSITLSHPALDGIVALISVLPVWLIPFRASNKPSVDG